MTERRPGEERGREQGKPGGAPTPHETQEDAILELQELAGNRAVADLLAEERLGVGAACFAGLRVRDLLRLARQPARAAVQRQPADPVRSPRWRIHDPRSGCGDPASQGVEAEVRLDGKGLGNGRAEAGGAGDAEG